MQSRWKTNEIDMRRLRMANRFGVAGKILSYVRFIDDFPAFPINNFWDDTSTAGFAEPKAYVVQTNMKVVERCMLMCTDPGDLMRDPTCGSETTAYVAEQPSRLLLDPLQHRLQLGVTQRPQRHIGAAVEGVVDSIQHAHHRVNVAADRRIRHTPTIDAATDNAGPSQTPMIMNGKPANNSTNVHDHGE
jgi:hypothetical protein